MGTYTDDELRALAKITVKIAADYLGISPMMVTLGMTSNRLRHQKEIDEGRAKKIAVIVGKEAEVC
jgi:hypothetical protein